MRAWVFLALCASYVAAQSALEKMREEMKARQDAARQKADSGSSGLASVRSNPPPPAPPPVAAQMQEKAENPHPDPEAAAAAARAAALANRPEDELPLNMELNAATAVQGKEGAEMIQELLSKRANVNVIGAHGWTPLHNAMITSYGYEQQKKPWDSVPLAKALIDGKADLNIRDAAGRTPLFFAVKSNDATLVELFKDADEIKEPRGPSALNRAIKDGHAASVEAMIVLGHDLEKDHVPHSEIRRLLENSTKKDKMPAQSRRLLEFDDVRSPDKEKKAWEL